MHKTSPSSICKKRLFLPFLVTRFGHEINSFVNYEYVIHMQLATILVTGT